MMTMEHKPKQKPPAPRSLLMTSLNSGNPQMTRMNMISAPPPLNQNSSHLPQMSTQQHGIQEQVAQVERVRQMMPELTASATMRMCQSSTAALAGGPLVETGMYSTLMSCERFFRNTQMELSFEKLLQKYSH